MQSTRPVLALHIDQQGTDGNAHQLHRTDGLRATSSTQNAEPVDSANRLQNASSIQRMLKTTTETGGLGDFPASRRLASSSLKSAKMSKTLPTSRGSSKHILSSTNLHHQRSHFGNGLPGPSISRHGLTPPTSGPDVPPPGLVSYQEPLRNASVEEYRTLSTTQSSYITQKLSYRHQYVQNARRHNVGQMQRVRPQSPFAYPTRLKRPGYRPSSPALSLSRSTHSGDLDRSKSFRTASPASMYNLNRVPTPWQQVANHSEPVLRYYPPVQQAPSSRASTPKPATGADGVSSSTRLSQVAMQYPGAWPISPAVTPPPLFYDYSEAFEEQTRVHRISVLIVTSPLPRIDSGHSQYWERPQNTESEFLVELPSGSHPAPVVELSVLSADSIRSQIEKDDDSEVVSKQAMQRQNSTKVLVSSSATPESSSSYPSPVNNTQIENTVEIATPLTHNALRSSASGQESCRETNDSENRDEPIFAQSLHTPTHNASSPRASTSSFRSSVHLEMLDESTAPTSGADTVDASPEGLPRTPTHRYHSTKCAHDSPQRKNPEMSLIATSEKAIENDHPEIVAPTPDRSVISLSNRDRFSKILGLDQCLHDTDGLAETPTSPTDRLSLEAAPSLGNEENMELGLPSPVYRRTMGDESRADREIEPANGMSNSLKKSDTKGIDDLAERPLSASPHSIHPSPVPFSSRETPKQETRVPANVRLSHRKTVINAGRKFETKCETLTNPFPIIEEQFLETDHNSFVRRPRSTNTDETLPTSSVSSLRIRTFTPPQNALRSEFPFAFTPLIQTSSDISLPEERDVTTLPSLRTEDNREQKGQEKPPGSELDVERISTASPATSRPWNLDTSYPWDNKKVPKLDVVMPPVQEENPLRAIETHPKFRLKIHRASSSTVSKLTKKNRSSEDTISSMIASSVDLLKSASSRRGPKPSVSIGPGHSNSSHDVMRTSPMQTRFVESFEQPSLVSPVVSLMPPSPGHDVRSFFSDDSSQGRPKGSLRKRLSDFRTRIPRANSIDHVVGHDRGLLSSAFGLSRASGRSSRQSQTTTVATSHRSGTRRLRRSIFAKIRAWFSQREKHIRHWKRQRSRVLQTDRSPLYDGV